MSTNTQTQNTLDAMLAQYASNANTYTKSESNVTFDLKNYFTTHLAPNEKTATKTVRLLPTKDGSSPFIVIHGHKVQVEGEWKTFICLKHEKNEDCPFCEANDALRATGKEADKELAKKYNAKKMYVVKLIDRDDEAHGPKFWRFNHDYRNQGVFDKIFGILQATKSNITDVANGRDLMILIGRDQNNRPTIQTISHMDPSPLSADAALVSKWTEDTGTWNDVYATKPYEFLEIIVKGGVPVYDKEAKKFVDKNATVVADPTANLDAELSLGVANVKQNVVAATAPATTAAVTTALVAEPVTAEDEADDLPF